MCAGRRQRVDGTLEGVEGVFLGVHRHGERLVIVVAAHVTLCHRRILQELSVNASRGILQSQTFMQTGYRQWLPALGWNANCKVSRQRRRPRPWRAFPKG